MELSLKMTDKELKKAKFPNIRENNSVKKNKRWIKIPLFIILVCILGVGLYFVYKGVQIGKDIGFKFVPSQLIEGKQEPELKKDSSGKYTNLLIVGIDTRENTKLLNTDVLIVASYNHETNDIVMISLPRDFHAQVNPDKYWFNKINSAYMINEQKEKGNGLPVLEEIVEEVVGLDIQYHIMVDFKAFVELIDAVGGVYVVVENSFTDKMYPLGKGYQTVSFKAGPQLMDGETALQYSRSRHSQQNGEGSDYARARRQQRVIDAFKDAVLSSETLLNPSKILALLSSVQDNVKVSEFSTNDIEAGVKILKDSGKQKTSSTYSFVLDPTAGNYSLISTDVVKNAGYAIAPKEGVGKYDNIQEYVQLILKEPYLYSTNPSIGIYDVGFGNQNTYKKTQEFKDEYRYLNVKFMGTKYKDKKDIYIFTKEESMQPIVDTVAKYFGTTNISKPEYLTNSLGGEDISILMGTTILQNEISNTSER